MAKKAIVELELQTDSYKASLVEIQKGNTTISDSAAKAAQTASTAFNETGKAAKAAFRSRRMSRRVYAHNFRTHGASELTMMPSGCAMCFRPYMTPCSLKPTRRQ